MDNSDNIFFSSTNKTNFLDPNHGDGNVPIENLNISVDLYVMPRNRSLIGVVEGDDKVKHIAELKDGSAPFFEGSKTGKDFSFTTDYTNIGDDDHSGRETLGITSINIEFNSAYMPLVTMQMVDIRGRHHEMGGESPYNAFFNFPYPIFKLVVKGYYGQPVEYMLHLTKYNASMDSNNGNFNITCNFTGYTYAYLSDMLLGYLKAVPYTSEGEALVRQKRLEDPNFLTFDELYEYAKVLNKDILSIKEDDEDVKKLVYGYKTLNEIQELKKEFINVLIINDYYDAIDNTGDFVFINPIPEKEEKFNNGLKQLKEKITALDDTGTLNTSLYQQNSNNYFKDMSRSEFLDEDNNILESYSGTRGLEILKDKVIFEKIALAFKAEVGVGFNINIFYFKTIIDDLNQGINKINKALDEYKVVVADKFFVKIEELEILDKNGETRTFNFSIENYIKVLCDHVDILMDAIRSVSKQAEGSSERNFELLNGDGTYDIHKSDLINKVYAFPDYKKKGVASYELGENNSGPMIFEDRWIGSDHGTIQEVIFVKELYEGMVKNKERDQNFQTYLENFSTQWYPVNPFDCLSYVGHNNAWITIGNTDKETDIIRLLIYRAIIFLGITVKDPTPEEVEAMAKLEANNAFIQINNSIMRSRIKNLNSSDKNFVVKKIREMVQTDVEATVSTEVGVETETNVIDKLIEGYDAHNDKYVGKYGNVGGEADKYYIPLTPEIMVRSGEVDPLFPTIDEVSVNPDNPLYFNNYTSNSKAKPDDGSLFIDIIKREDYAPFTLGSPYGTRMIEKLNKTKIFSESELKNSDFNLKNTLFNGGWLTNEFMEYKSESNDVIPFYNYFYENESSRVKKPMFSGPLKNDGTRSDEGKTISGLFRGNNNNEKQSLPHINFYTSELRVIEAISKARPYSLFGSEYYYNQIEYGRALLFLHSLPFRGLQSDSPQTNTIFNREIINLFNKKGGIIEVPYTWILLIGGLLYRSEEDDMLLFDNTDYIVLPISENKYDLPKRDDFLRLNSFHKNQHCYDRNPHKSNATYGKDDYRKLDEVIKNLPVSVKNKFKDEFKSWVDGGDFKKISSQLEIFNYSIAKKRSLYWASMYNIDDELVNTGSEFKDHPIINQTARSNYRKVVMDMPDDAKRYQFFSSSATPEEIREYFIENVAKKYGGSPFNFKLELKDDSTAVQMVIDLMNTSRVIINGSWRIWSEDKNDITFKKEDLNKYINFFIDEFDRSDTELNESGEKSFGMTNSDDIYLTIYKNIKSIKDKWVNNYSGSNGLPFNNLIKSFKFIDRGYNNVGKAFKLNPMDITSLLSDTHNTSFYAHASKILSKNNFDFIAMPNFVNYSDPKLMSSVFKTYSYNEASPTVEPAFVCMYVGERSNVLEGNSNYLSDSFNLNENDSETPDDFNKVPVFLVKYGDLNQSIFKGLDLDQSEFSETNESLSVTDQIANSYNNVNSVGQNLFNIYNNRAYNSKVQMMGNSMIQPFMYYQLDNVPMFRGAYVIIKVQHSITPNSMTTTFTGNRVKKARTKLLDKVTIFNNLIGNFGDIQAGSGSLNDIMGGGTRVKFDNNRINDIGPLKAGEVRSNTPAPVFGALGYGAEDESLIQLTKNFTLEDFAATDGVTKTPLEYRDGIQELANNLQVLRDHFNLPITITNGYRTDAKHAELLKLWKSNKTKYNEPGENSLHRIGEAADIKINGKTPKEVYDAIEGLIKNEKMTNGGMGLYNSFVHYDIRNTKPERW